jgi:hypothetical protein
MATQPIVITRTLHVGAKLHPDFHKVKASPYMSGYQAFDWKKDQATHWSPRGP